MTVKSKSLWQIALALAMSLTVAAVAQQIAQENTLTLIHAKVYPSPTARLIQNATVVVQGENITQVGKADSIVVPPRSKVLDCTGMTVVAGFQNSHAHLTEEMWNDAAQQTAAKVQHHLTAMFNRYGDTTVVDLGSPSWSTTAVQRRIESGDVLGPRILTAVAPLYPHNGLPFYVRDLPPSILKLLPQPESPAEAIDAVRRNVGLGAGVIKLFTGSLFTVKIIKPMDLNIARAAVTEAHRTQRLVFTHPSNIAGLEIALSAGVDVAAHTTPLTGPWKPALIQAMRRQGMALVPTLQLWKSEAAKSGSSPEEQNEFAMVGAQQLGQFAKAGGQILFGTDVGYMLNHDPTEEYVLMSRAGLTAMQILASLTTAPATRFNESKSRGKIEPGMDADLAVLKADPSTDVRNFAQVQYTIRRSKLIYEAVHKASR